MALSQDFVASANEWLKWFNWNYPDMKNAPLERKVAFLMKANLGAYKIMSGLADEVDRGGRVSRPAGLVLPAHVAWR